VKLPGKLSAGSVGVAAVFDCAVTVIVPLASPLTVTVPLPLTFSLPEDR
jgi:hypothetical protein